MSSKHYARVTLVQAGHWHLDISNFMQAALQSKNLQSAARNLQTSDSSFTAA